MKKCNHQIKTYKLVALHFTEDKTGGRIMWSDTLQ